MRRALVFAIVAVIIVASVAGVSITGTVLSNNKNHEFYVGVTYCGDSVEEAKLLIDKAKDYTNLFILPSGSLQHNIRAVDVVGDYGVDSGLNFMSGVSLVPIVQLRILS